MYGGYYVVRGRAVPRGRDVQRRGRHQRGFFVSSDNQNAVFSTNEWEPVPLNNDMMCANFCSEECGWASHAREMWSTQHWYFGNHEEVVSADFDYWMWGEGEMDCMVQGISCCL